MINDNLAVQFFKWMQKFRFPLLSAGLAIDIILPCCKKIINCLPSRGLKTKAGGGYDWGHRRHHRLCVTDKGASVSILLASSFNQAKRPVDYRLYTATTIPTYDERNLTWVFATSYRGPSSSLLWFNPYWVQTFSLLTIFW